MSHSMTTELEEAQQAYREAARDFAQAELAPHAARWDAEGIFPREAIAKPVNWASAACTWTRKWAAAA